jgi:hypothetical protein
MKKNSDIAYPAFNIILILNIFSMSYRHNAQGVIWHPWFLPHHCCRYLTHSYLNSHLWDIFVKPELNPLTEISKSVAQPLLWYPHHEGHLNGGPRNPGVRTDSGFSMRHWASICSDHPKLTFENYLNLLKPISTLYYVFLTLCWSQVSRIMW